MATENVNIAFRSTGIPVIKRQLDELGVAANKATRGFFLLQRAMYTIGGFGLARALTSSLDALTNMENKLRLTTNSTAELEGVQRELFEIAIRSRTSWEGVSEIYNRAALSAKALGIAQKDVLIFTEGVSKAAVASGAGAQEARAALIQLGQAMASNRLGGDELRSVLEQLPMVADIIANYMTSTNQYGVVTRGNIRQLGKEGKITAQVMVDAFKWAETELDATFAGMPLTIGQALEIARTKWMMFLDDFDDTYDISGKIASAIMLVANNLDVIAETAVRLGVLLAGAFAGKAIASVVTYINSLTALGVKQTAALSRLVAIRSATVASTTADLAANAARQNELRQNLALIGQRKALLLAQIRETEFTVKNNLARSIQTGRFVALEASKMRLAQQTINLSRLEAIEAAQAGRLTAARAAQATATNALAGAQGRLGAAQAAQATIGARLAAMFPTISGLFATIARLGPALLNPYVLIGTVIAGLTFAFVKWGNEIKVTADGVVGLKDVALASFQLMWEKIQEFGAFIWDLVSPGLQKISTGFWWLYDQVVNVMAQIASIVYSSVNILIGTFVGFINGTIAAWDILPAALKDVMVMAWNGILDATETGINGIIDAIQRIPEFFGMVWDSVVEYTGAAANWLVEAFKGLPGAIWTIAKQAAAYLKDILIGAVNSVIEALNSVPGIAIDTFKYASDEIGKVEFKLPEGPKFDSFIKDGKVSLDQFKGTVTGAAAEAGKAYSGAFTDAYSRDFIGEGVDAVSTALAPIGSAIIDRARENIEKDKNKVVPPGGGDPPPAPPGGGGGGGKGGSQSKDFAAIIAEMEQEIRLLQLSSAERKIQQELLKIEKELKRSLTDQERELAIATIQNLEAMKLQAEIMDSIEGPRDKAIQQMAALNALYAQGKLTIQEYTAEMLKANIAANQASMTLGGGFRASLGQALMNVQQLGAAMGDALVSAVDGASSALAEFAMTGELNIHQVFATLFQNLLKLAMNQLFMRLLGGMFGIPLPGIGGGGGIGSLFGFSGGGSILPTGPGSTDSQIVAFKKRPDERVDILTPGQQASQAAALNSNSATQAAPAQVNVAAVLSEDDIINTFDGDKGETVILRVLERNPGRLRGIMGG